MKIEWMPVLEFPGYEVSSNGEVRSLNYNREGKTKLLTPSFDKNKYLKVGVTKEKKLYNRYVHRLVAAARHQWHLDYACVGLDRHNSGCRCYSRWPWARCEIVQRCDSTIYASR